MPNETGLYEIPADRMVYTHERLGASRELGEAEIVHTIWGKTRIRVVTTQGSAKWPWLLATLVVAAGGAAGWYVTSETEPAETEPRVVSAPQTSAPPQPIPAQNISGPAAPPTTQAPTATAMPPDSAAPDARKGQPMAAGTPESSASTPPAGEKKRAKKSDSAKAQAATASDSMQTEQADDSNDAEDTPAPVPSDKGAPASSQP